MTIAMIMVFGFCIGMAALFVAALTGEQDYRAKMQVSERKFPRVRPQGRNVHFLALKSQ